MTRRYLHSDAGSPAERVWPDADTAPGDEAVRLRAVRVRDADGVVAESMDIRRPMTLEVEYWNLSEGHRPTVSVWFTNEDGVCLFASNDFNNREWWETPRRAGLVRSTCHVPGNFFAEGQIFVLAAVCHYNPNVVHAIERDAVSFLVVDSTEGDGVRGEHVGPWPGVVRPMLRWEIRT